MLVCQAAQTLVSQAGVSLAQQLAVQRVRRSWQQSRNSEKGVGPLQALLSPCTAPCPSLLCRAPGSHPETCLILLILRHNAVYSSPGTACCQGGPRIR